MIENTLAEAAGIFAGDGTFYKTQRGFVLEVRGPSKEKPYYEEYIAPIFSEVLKSKIKVINRDKEGRIIGIRNCTKLAKEVFHQILEFPIGRKENIVQVPRIIFDSSEKNVIISYLRGVFDTDGCVALTQNRGNYKKPIVDFGTCSNKHQDQILEMLTRLGFNAHKQKCRVRIGGWSTVKNFFEIIQPHNYLKVNKWIKLLEVRNAEVA